MTSFRPIKRTDAVLAIVVFIGFGGIAAAASPAYYVTDLGTLGGAYSEARGINISGQVTGLSSLSGNTVQHAFLWTPASTNGLAGTMQDIGTLGGSYSYGNGINSAGHVAGTSQLAGNATTHAFIYDGALHDLGTLGGAYSEARDINDAGQITGESETTSRDSRAFICDGTMHDLGTLGGSGSSGYGINNSQQVTGFSQTTSSGGAFLHDGSMHDLGPSLHGIDSAGSDINSGGQVTGTYQTADDLELHAFLWSPIVPNGVTGAALDLGTLGGTTSRGWSVNSHGHVTGASGTLGDAASHAFVYTSESGMVDLNSLIDPLSGWELQFGAGINDAGQITGKGLIGGEVHAFLLTPIAAPEPTPLLLLAFILPLFLLHRSRKHAQNHVARFITASLLGLFAQSCVARADIFQWEYINPTNPAQGKKQSTTLAPQGAGVNADHGAYLVGRNLTKAYLIGADLTPLNEWENYVPSNLTYTNLSQADLTGANLWDAYLISTNFSQADLTGAYCGGAFLADANFSGAEIRNANFQYTSLSPAQIQSTSSYANHNLTGLAVAGTQLSGVNLANQNLTNTDFSFASLAGANFNQANLINAKLPAVDARGVDFGHANLTNANLSGVDMRGANVQNATFTGANTTDVIQPNGHIAGLNGWVVVRDYNGNPSASPPTGPLPIVVDQHWTGEMGMRMRFESDDWNSTVSFAPGIPVSLGGTLWLTFEPGVNLASQIGRTIDLFDWSGVTPTGTFNVQSNEEYTWDLTKLYTTGEVTLTAALGIVPGDFNYNGVVDAADYIAWRKTDGSQIDYNTWRAHFGQSFSSAFGATAGLSSSTSPFPLPPSPFDSPVPEPLSLPHVLVWVACFSLLRRKATTT